MWCERLGCECRMTGVLTRRQRDVLSAAAQGLTAQEIAVRMGLGYNTVKHHIVAARAALGAHSTAHAVALAIRTGLIQ